MINKPSVVITTSGVRRGDLDQLFSRAMNPWQHYLPLSNGKWQPNTDILEYTDKFLIRMELAGVQKDQINIVCQNNKLLVYGQRHDPLNDGQVRYLQLEINYHEFEKIIQLSEEVNVDQIGAELENGILTIELPRRQIVENHIKINVR